MKDLTLGLTNRTTTIQWDAYPLTIKLLTFYSTEHWPSWRESVDIAIDRWKTNHTPCFNVVEGSGIEERAYEDYYVESGDSDTPRWV